MDTLEEPIEPAGSDDVTSSPDTSMAETQSFESPESFDGGDGAEKGSQEVLLAGKYKSPEELEKGYKELEGKLGTFGQKAAIADMIQEQYGLTPEQFKAAIAEEKRQKEEALYQENPGAYAVQKVQALEQQLAYREEEAKLNDFIRENPDAAPFKDKIFDLGLNLYNGETREEKSFEEIYQDYFAQARANGQTDAYKKIDAKQRTQTTGTQSAPAKKFTEADLENMSSKEMEALLPFADVSHRPY